MCYTSFKRTVNPSDFEKKRFPLNACLLSRPFQTGKVQAKGEKYDMARVKQQALIIRTAQFR